MRGPLALRMLGPTTDQNEANQRGRKRDQVRRVRKERVRDRERIVEGMWGRDMERKIQGSRMPWRRAHREVER